MNRIKLGDNHSFGIEFYGKKARLVVYTGSVENVCRRESLKKLQNFIQSNENHLFKGRLQLHKNTAGISVLLKGEKVGDLSNQAFLRIIGE